MNINIFYMLGIMTAMVLQPGCAPQQSESSYLEEQRLKRKIEALNAEIDQARLQKNHSSLRVLLRERERYIMKVRTIRQYRHRTPPSPNFDFIPSLEVPYPYSTKETRAQIQRDAALAQRLQAEEIYRAEQQQRRQDEVQRAQMRADEALARRVQAEEIWRAEQEQRRKENEDARRAQIQADEAMARRLQAEEIRRAEQRTQSDAQKAQIESDRALAEQLQKEENQRNR